MLCVVFISGGNPRLTSRFCRDELGPTTFLKIYHPKKNIASKIKKTKVTSKLIRNNPPNETDIAYYLQTSTRPAN